MKETKHNFLLDILGIMKDSGRSVTEMVIVIQAYIQEMDFLDEEGSRRVKELLKTNTDNLNAKDGE